MRAAIYARSSSENQRPESTEDQVRACRTHAAAKTHLVVLEDHIYTDQAMSGANPDRPGLTALRAAAQRHSFDVVLVGDLSCLARDNALMLLVLNDLRYAGVRVISVADHLDTSDENALLGIQVRGVFNELALSDLKKKTHRGQLGQKQRGYFVGEAALGYRSEAAGTISYDKHGRARPEGFLMHVDPAEAEVVRRIFREAAEGRPFTRIMKGLNEDGVPGRIRSAHGWTVGSVRRILENTKYRGHWVWNKRGTCRDRRTGHRRWFLKPESEWVVCDDEALRIVPQELWDRVAERLREIKRVWPGGEARRGFGPGQVSRVHAYPPYLLSGAMVCGDCGRAIALVSGHRGGYYGCSAAARRACGNRVRVPRRVAEKVVLAALRDRVLRPEPVMQVLDRVREEITKLCADVPGLLRAKRAQLAQARGRVARIVNFVALGRAQDSKALAEALVKDEALVASLEVEVEGLQSASDSRVRFPSRPWVEKRLAAFRELLERRTEASALVLRRLLGRMVLKPVYPEQGKPYYVARTAIDVLVLLEPPGSDPSSDPGANSFGWWRRRVLHFSPHTTWGCCRCAGFRRLRTRRRLGTLLQPGIGLAACTGLRPDHRRGVRLPHRRGRRVRDVCAGRRASSSRPSMVVT